MVRSSVRSITGLGAGTVRTGTFLGTLLLLLLLVTGSADAAVLAPHDIVVFPNRDYVSATGYAVGVPATVQVFHPGALLPVGTVDVMPVEDPATPGLGTVDVNHPGGACWVTTTPDIRPGDTVTISQNGAPDSTVVANVTTGRPVQTAPGTVLIRGSATDAAGAPLPLAALEQRLIIGGGVFAKNGRRTLRAPGAPGGDGTLRYDVAGGTSWTASYTGLTASDVTKALAATAAINWIGVNESTSAENGAGAVGGPSIGCTAPLEKLPPAPGADSVPPTDPTGLTAKVSNGNTVELRWTASTDNVGVVDYGVYRDGIPIATVQRPDGAAGAPTGVFDNNVPPGQYVYTVDAGDAAGNRSGPTNPGATVTTTRSVATLPPGTVVNDPPVAPVQIISFPSRDFVSSSGFLASDTVEVQVLRRVGGVLTLVSASTTTPQPDPRAGPTDPFAGMVEVNHPGGSCWDGSTPDIRAGDVIREIARNPDNSIRTVNQTRTATVVAKRPVVVRPPTGAAADGVVEVHGSAISASGDPLPLSQVESRLVANRDAFDLNGRRTIRAGGAGKDGTLVYDSIDASGVTWTATFSGLTADDVARSVGGTSPTSGRTFAGAESRALWLGLTPASAPEITIYENDGGTTIRNGTAPPCVGLAEPLDTNPPTFPTTPGALSAAPVPGTTDVKLDWSAASDDVAVFGYRVYRDDRPLKELGPGTLTYTDTNVAGAHTYTVDANDAASPGPGGNGQGSPWGNRSAPTAPATATALDTVAPSTPANLVGVLAADSISVDLSWAASKDNVGVAGYTVYRRDAGTTAWTKLADVGGSALAYNDADPALLPGNVYEYTVDATDAAANRSGQAAAATVILGADTTAPSVPANVAAGTPDIHVKDVRVTWSASTDNVAVTGYAVYGRQVDPSAASQSPFVKLADVNGTTRSYTDANRPAGTYDYAVDAVDSAGNRSAQSGSSQAVTANDPPAGKHSIIPFPARDFVSSTGYALGEGPVTVSVLRGGQTVARSTPIGVVEDSATPGFGTVEVNHVGGGCWGAGLLPDTPNLVGGDVVRFTDKSGVAEQTTIADVVAERPIVTRVDPATGGGTLEVHGSARTAAGTPIPVDQVENRLVANRDAFDLSGRRTLRAGGAGSDGTLTYDSPGSTRWTATYVLPTATDLARAAGGITATGQVYLGAESRGVWLGRTPATLSELTIQENGTAVVGGPAAGILGCTSGPAETPAPGAALSPAPPAAPAPPASATLAGLTYGGQVADPTTPVSASQAVTLTNDGTAPLRIDRVYLAGLNPGDFRVTAQRCPTAPATLAPGAACTVDVAFKALASGQRQANVSFADNAANTADQSVALSGSATDPAVSSPGAPVQTLKAGTRLTLAPSTAASTIPVTLAWAPSSTTSTTSYELQQSDGGGAWTAVTKPDLDRTATASATLGSLSAPITHQWRVRACSSTAGACSVWVTGTRVTTAPVDNSTSTAYKSMSGQTLAGAFGGSVQWASVAGATATPNQQTFTVAGNAAWVTRLGPDRGRATVRVDGRAATTVDLYAATPTSAAVAWVANGAADGLTAGTSHTITVTVVGASNGLSTGTRVDHDAAVFLR